MHAAAIPQSEAYAALSVPELMLRVMREKEIQGQPTTRDDFHQAEETCHLSDAALDQHIGAAKRLASIDPRTVEGPLKPVQPWDFDRDYRRERVERAATLITGLLPGDDVAVQALKSNGYSNAEIAALWPEFMQAAGHRVAMMRMPEACGCARTSAASLPDGTL